MTISLQDISKRYGLEWILKKVNLELITNNQYAVIGPNGSGKSTLLKIIANGIVPTHGTIQYTFGGITSPSDFDINKNIAFTAPYISILEEMTLEEMYHFHSKLQTMHCENLLHFLDIIELQKHRNKYIKHFSSGMKQRVKLALAILSKAEVLILDEPSSNLDEKATEWYLNLVQQYLNNRIVLIGSNQEREYAFCKHQINVLHYK
ncbi:MAG: ABC transporter ATP-binding protein [Chitinophagales bacterium]